MKFLDQVKIYIKAGNGGDGSPSFRREKFIEFGGPDGGDGGKGGSVILKAEQNLNTLIDFRYQQHFKAKKGEDGKGQNKTGANGKDLIIKVPPGTEIYNENKEVYRDWSSKYAEKSGGAEIIDSFISSVIGSNDPESKLDGKLNYYHIISGKTMSDGDNKAAAMFKENVKILGSKFLDEGIRWFPIQDGVLVSRGNLTKKKFHQNFMSLFISFTKILMYQFYLILHLMKMNQL